MRTDLPGNPNRPSRAPRAYFPCKIALYLGRAPFWAPRGARRDPVVHSRLISGRLHTASYPVVYRSGILDRTVLAPPGMAARARTREVLRPDRDLATEARSPPTQMSCGVEPEL